MVKRTIEISQQPVHLTVKNEQLLILGRDEHREQLGSVPCEDIGMVLVDHAGTTYTHAALTMLLKYDAALVVCGRNHLPAGLLLPLGEHSQVVWRIHDQLAVKKPLQKQLWRQLVQAKIRAQARNLPEKSPARSRLLGLARQVRSGDPSNVEAQAARAYWSALFADVAFRRDPDGEGLNALLNYGYAVVRAALARAIVGAGLLPALGLHHARRSDAFCLADDLIEPLRPLVDLRVLALQQAGETELNPKTKAELLPLLAAEVRIGDQSGPLMVALHRMVASLVHCYDGTARRLEIPVSCGAGPARPSTDAAPAPPEP